MEARAGDFVSVNEIVQLFTMWVVPLSSPNLYEDLNNARTSVEIIQVVVTRLRCRKVQNARSKQIVIEHLSLLRRCMLKVSVGGGKETSKEYQWRTRKYLSMSLCGGTDELWAGFKELYMAVENHYGRENTYTHALKKEQLFVTVFLKLIVSTSIIAGGVAMFCYLENEAQSSVDYMTILIGGILWTVIGLVAAVRPGISVVSFGAVAVLRQDSGGYDVAGSSCKTKAGLHERSEEGAAEDRGPSWTPCFPSKSSRCCTTQAWISSWTVSTRRWSCGCIVCRAAWSSS